MALIGPLSSSRSTRSDVGALARRVAACPEGGFRPFGPLRCAGRVLRSARHKTRRVVAKPVRFRHSPATVTVPSGDGSPVAGPTVQPLEPSRERGRQA